MAKYDIENMLADIRKILMLNLNNYISSVEAEKISQGLPPTSLLPVDINSGYFEQSWSPANLNITPAIHYGFETIQAQGIGPETIETWKIFVEIILVDAGNDSLANHRINRYTRAIKDTLQANYDRFPNSSRIKIETVRPISFKLDENSSEEIRVGGVSLTTAMG